MTNHWSAVLLGGTRTNAAHSHGHGGPGVLAFIEPQIDPDGSAARTQRREARSSLDREFYGHSTPRTVRMRTRNTHNRGRLNARSLRMAREQAWLDALKHEVIADFAATRTLRRIMEMPQIVLFLLIIGAATIVPIIIDVFLMRDIAANGLGSVESVLKLAASGALNAAGVFVLRLSRRLSEVIRAFMDEDAWLTQQISLVRSARSAAALHQVLRSGRSRLVPAVALPPRKRRGPDTPGAPAAGASGN